MHKANICVRYAKALFEYASQRGRENDVYISFQLLMKNIEHYPLLKEILESPSIKPGKKRELMITAAGIKIPEEFSSFIDLLLKNGRESELYRISLCYTDIYRARKEISTCKLITAVPIDKNTEERIISMIVDKTKGSVEMEKRVDPSILGGFIFEMNYNLLDASIATQLKEIRKGLMAGNI